MRKICTILLLLGAASINVLILIFLAGTNRLASNDEARNLSAGASLWSSGDVHSVNDFPPLARVVTVLPLLPLHIKVTKESLNTEQPAEVASTCDQELYRAGEFLHVNPEPFYLVFFARMTGFLWWFLGAGIIFRWSNQLHGRRAACLSVILWSCCPTILGYEQFATPSFPSAVAYLAATYAFTGYLLMPSWRKALLFGVLLGVALIVDFTCLVLLLIFPFLAVVYRFMSERRPSPSLRLRDRAFHVVLVIGLATYVVNAGYGFDRSGLPLGKFNFASHALSNGQGPVREPSLETATGNRFQRSWLGQLLVPVPAEYLIGLDRRWHEWEVPQTRDDEDEWLVEMGSHFSSTVGGDLPLSLRVILPICLILAVRRHCGSPPLADELVLWGTVLSLLAMTTSAVGILPTASGSLLAVPFAIIIASRITIYWSSARRLVRWLALGLSVWCVGDCVKTTYDRFFSPNRTTRFQQDLVRQSRKLGLKVPEPKQSVGLGSQERGLTYRTFIDSRGERINYALFIPKSYRGDRPFPLILFLHGWGDRRKSPTDRMFTEVGLPFTLKYQSVDFLVLIPQGISGYWNADSDDARMALELLDFVQGQYQVDPKRISLTGLSSGGSGAWGIAAQEPSRWAAIVPVASSCNPSQAHLIQQIPCWCFHNRYDKGSPAYLPKEMVASMKELGGHPRYTEYADTNHNAGERAYLLPELYHWLSQQRRP